jgi:hypothetical protein
MDQQITQQCPTTNQPTDQPNDQPTNRPTTEELKYTHHRAQRLQHPTNNMVEVWQKLAPFGGTPTSGAVEVLLTKVVNW